MKGFKDFCEAKGEGAVPPSDVETTRDGATVVKKAPKPTDGVPNADDKNKSKGVKKKSTKTKMKTPKKDREDFTQRIDQPY